MNCRELRSGYNGFFYGFRGCDLNQSNFVVVIFGAFCVLRARHRHIPTRIAPDPRLLTPVPNARHNASISIQYRC